MWYVCVCVRVYGVYVCVCVSSVSGKEEGCAPQLFDPIMSVRKKGGGPNQSTLLSTAFFGVSPLTNLMLTLLTLKRMPMWTP